MGFFSRKKSFLNWNLLTQSNQLKTIMDDSFIKPQLIFKHSTRCGISRMVKQNFENDWTENSEIAIYLLDLLAYRSLSDEIATQMGVQHQSPQAIAIKDGEVVYQASHHEITVSSLLAKIS